MPSSYLQSNQSDQRASFGLGLHIRCRPTLWPESIAQWILSTIRASIRSSSRSDEACNLQQLQGEMIDLFVGDMPAPCQWTR
jgi:hypothetical protein